MNSLLYLHLLLGKYFCVAQAWFELYGFVKVYLMVESRAI